MITNRQNLLNRADAEGRHDETSKQNFSEMAREKDGYKNTDVDTILDLGSKYMSLLTLLFFTYFRKAPWIMALVLLALS